MTENCPACGDDGHAEGTARGVTIHRCTGNGCGMRFLAAAVRPNTANDNAWYEEWESASAEQVLQARAGMSQRYRRQLGLLARECRSRTVLDVGSGLGLFVAEARDAGWAATGLELSPHGRAFASNVLGVDARSSFAEIERGAFAAVRASHVLEHIPQPLSFLTECRDALQPHGVMLVIVPHREPLAELAVNGVRGMLGRDEVAGAVYPDMHVLGFDHQALTSVMSRAGFDELWIRGIGMGDAEFYPWFYDDLVHVLPFRRWTKLGWRYCLPRVVNRVGAFVGRGDWIAGMFRKRC